MDQFNERTLVIIKPDGVRRGLIGAIVSRLENVGLAIVGIKSIRPTLEFARGHYATTPEQLRQMGGKTLETYAELGIDPVTQLGTSDALEIGTMVHEWNAEFLSSDAVVAMVVEGAHAVKKVRALAGKTMPKDAAPGTIRGDFGSTSPAIANLKKAAVHNLLHASDNDLDPDEPSREISYWFADKELAPYVPVDTEVLF